MKNNKELINIDLPPKPYVIELQKHFFEKSYSIYILEINHKKNKIYYIENLINRRIISVKYPIIRLGQLFEENKSSKNNIIFKYILNKIIEPYKDPDRRITDKHKYLVNQFLSETDIKMAVYPVIKFDFNSLKNKQHKENVKQVLDFEQQVIRLFDMHSKKLINEGIPTMYVRYDDILFPKIWHKIKTDFYI